MLPSCQIPLLQLKFFPRTSQPTVFLSTLLRLLHRQWCSRQENTSLQGGPWWEGFCLPFQARAAPILLRTHPGEAEVPFSLWQKATIPDHSLTVQGRTSQRGTTSLAGAAWHPPNSSCAEPPHPGLRPKQRSQRWREGILPLCSALLRPHLKCCVHLWGPKQKRGMDLLEEV